MMLKLASCNVAAVLAILNRYTYNLFLPRLPSLDVDDFQEYVCGE